MDDIQDEKIQIHKCLNSNVLKLIAIIAMTIDHIAWASFAGYPNDTFILTMHIIGRITCPIMCYFIAEGYYYTKNIRKYLVRLFLFAFISHFAYVFASNNFVDARSFIPFYFGSIMNQTSVMWSLAIGLVMLIICDSSKLKGGIKVLLIILCCIIAFPSDWSCIAALCVLAIGCNRGKLKIQYVWIMFYTLIYAIVYFFTIDKIYGLVQLGVVFSFPLIYLYNGKRGSNIKVNKFMKWFFYLYYPIHLLVIGYIFKILIK